MINLRDENSQEVSREGQLFLEVECQRLIVIIADILILATHPIMSFNWLCSQVSGECSIIARAVLSIQIESIKVK